MTLAFVGGSYGAAPINTVAPVVSGTATVGQTLSTTDGTWTGAPAPTFTYQWQRTGVNIGGATSSTYVLDAADYANTIRCVVTATNVIAPSGVAANSNSTASVAGTAPVNTVAPVVSGTANFGSTLTTTNGTWTGVPTPTFTYQWQRVTTNISGATSSTYIPVQADVGSTLRCVVTATNVISAVSANSNSTASVAAIVPGAPTIGTATATSSSTASVPFTAPASDGGSTITSYTATSSPSGITGTVSQAGSGTITVSGLASSTSYTFTVTATNSVGTSLASSASNSITTLAPSGQQEFTSVGTYSYFPPLGVTSVSVVAVGGGSYDGAGGLGWKNSIPVSYGSPYSVQVGDQGTNSFFINSSTVAGLGASSSTGGSYVGDGGGNGGGSPNDVYPGGGGAGGYTGNGGQGGSYASPGQPGTGGGGGGGHGGQHGVAGGSGGGGVGILGLGSPGSGGSYFSGGNGGSGGNAGQPGNPGGGVNPGGSYGSNKRAGAVRVIWGPGRSYPSNASNV